MTSICDIPGIPIVVRDAIQFVAAMGERYLWVDCLCIVQDNTENKHKNISQMDRIYASAVFTIVASGESGDHPLPGVRPGTRVPQVSDPAGGIRLKRGSQSRDFALHNPVWNARGWTFQEMHLSRRRVIFTAHKVFCKCDDSSLAELNLGEPMFSPDAGNDPLLYLSEDPHHPPKTRVEEVRNPDSGIERCYTAFGSALLSYRSLV